MLLLFEYIYPLIMTVNMADVYPSGAANGHPGYVPLKASDCC